MAKKQNPKIINIRFNFMWIWGAIIAIILAYSFFGEGQAEPVACDWNTVEQMVVNGEVERIKVVNKNTAQVYLQPDQVSLAIGKGGLNIRLAKLLTGFDIDVFRELDEEDVALTEFADEIDGWIIDTLHNMGCDTAKSVLEMSAEVLAKRADLEIEQAEQVVAILKAEFE